MKANGKHFEVFGQVQSLAGFAAALGLFALAAVAQPCEQLTGRVVFCGEPLRFIELGHWNGNGELVDTYWLGTSGEFAVIVPAGQQLYRLVFRAINDATAVLDASLMPCEFSTGLQTVPTAGSCDLGTIDVGAGADCAHPADSAEGRNGLGLWLAGQMGQVWNWFRQNVPSAGDPPPINVLYPGHPDPASAAFFAPSPGAWYLGIGRDAYASLFHEYGHYLTANYATWVYGAPDYQSDDHGGCSALWWHAIPCAGGCETWPYLEGIAHWIRGLAHPVSRPGSHALVGLCAELHGPGQEPARARHRGAGLPLARRMDQQVGRVRNVRTTRRHERGLGVRG